MTKFLTGKTVTIRGMQVFRSGRWNNQEFDVEKLDLMVQNFNALKGQLVPKLKITHRDDQESLAGLAGYGDMVRLFREGDALYADFERVPEEVAQWIRDGRFAERSIELYHSFDVSGVKYAEVISAVSLLGHEIPAVAGMEPVKLSDKDNIINSKELVGVKFSLSSDKEKFNIEDNNEGGEKRMELKELIAKIEEMGKTIASFVNLQKDAEAKMAKEADEKAKVALKEKVDGYEMKVKELETIKADFEKVKASLQKVEAEKADIFQKAKESDIDTFISALKAEGKLLPAQETEVKALLFNASTEKKVGKFSIEKDGKTEEVEMTEFELLKSTFSKLPKVIEMKEISSNGKEVKSEDKFAKGSYEMPNEDEFAVSSADLHIEAQKYAKEHKCSYEEAVIAVSVQFKKENKSQGLTSQDEE